MRWGVGWTGEPNLVRNLGTHNHPPETLSKLIIHGGARWVGYTLNPTHCHFWICHGVGASSGQEFSNLYEGHLSMGLNSQIQRGT